MKVIIAGGRDFDNYELLKEKCDYYLSNVIVTQIVSGGQVSKLPNGIKYGADYLGEQYAKEKKYKVKIFLYRSEFGKAGGPIRNKEMARYADALIAFWDGVSRGTADMISQANYYRITVRIVFYQQIKTGLKQL